MEGEGVRIGGRVVGSESVGMGGWGGRGRG